MLKSGVFLDRDGVLSRAFVRNGKSYAPRRLKDFRLLPYAAASVRRLKRAGFVVIVITNQPDIANALVRSETVDAMHKKLLLKTKVDGIFVCPHNQHEGCYCRKPKPGMIFKAARKYQIDLRASYVVGDRASDIEAGRRAGCRGIFVDRKYAERAPETQVATVSSLRSATKFILNQIE